MKHRDTTESVEIRKGMFSSTIFEMELWTLSNDLQFSDEEYQEQLQYNGKMSCGLQLDSTGLFPTKKEALDTLEMCYDDPSDNYLAFIREKAMYCMMPSWHYLKEWTYIYNSLHDESIVRIYDEYSYPFFGRPKEMVRFRQGDIVMVPEGNSGHWGIVYAPPLSKERIMQANMACNERLEPITGTLLLRQSYFDWSDDNYAILTSNKNYEASHENIIAHHVLPALQVPDFVRDILEEGLQKVKTDI